MRKRNKISLLSLGLILSSLLIFSQNSINYNDYIKSIRENYPLARRANNIAAQGKYNYNMARGNYDPMLSSVYENKFYNSENYFSTLHAELRQPLFTNQYLIAGYEYGQGNYLDPSGLTSSGGTSFLGVEASLLQGLLFDKRRAEVLKAKEYKTYYDAERNQILNQVLFDASIQFAEWSYAEKELSLYQFFLDLANKRYLALVDLSLIGERAAVDTIEASLLYQSRYLEYQSTKLDNQKMQNKVLSYYWENNNTPIKYDTTLVIFDSLEIYFRRAESLAVLELQGNDLNNPTIIKYNSINKILDVEKRYKAELIKPKLDVKYNFLSEVSNPYSTNYSINNYKWGAKLSMPLFLRSARNDYKIAQLNSNNNNYELINKQNELDLKLNVIKQAIFILEEQIKLSEKNVKYSKQLLEAEKLKFENGESSLFLINTRETKWLESELKLAEYRTKFIKVVFELVNLKGTSNYKL